VAVRPESRGVRPGDPIHFDRKADGIGLAFDQPVDSKKDAPSKPSGETLSESRSSDGLPVVDPGTEDSELLRHGYINRGAAGYGSEDEALQQAVLEALIEDPKLHADRIGVRVKDAAATLEGSVASTSNRALAVQLAQRVPGITAVRDRLSICSVTAQE